MARVAWAPHALKELEEIVAYIEHFDAVAADKIAGKILAAGESLADFPNRGRPVADGCRELPSVPPFVIYYEVSGDTVDILDVRHGRRRPLAS